jgi:transcription elongation factor GreA
LLVSVSAGFTRHSHPKRSEALVTEIKWLTQQAYDSLTAELADREGPRRAHIVSRIQAAREEGDLKENGGYHAAKDEQGKNEGRIVVLKHTLKIAQIGLPESAEDEAAHGKVVTVSFPALDMEQTFLLAAREEAAHVSIEVYSASSPLGAAINGRKVGEKVSYELPTGKSMEVQILKVSDYEG